MASGGGQSNEELRKVSEGDGAFSQNSDRGASAGDGTESQNSDNKAPEGNGGASGGDGTESQNPDNEAPESDGTKYRSSDNEAPEGDGRASGGNGTESQNSDNEAPAGDDTESQNSDRDASAGDGTETQNLDRGESEADGSLVQSSDLHRFTIRFSVNDLRWKEISPFQGTLDVGCPDVPTSWLWEMVFMKVWNHGSCTTFKMKRTDHAPNPVDVRIGLVILDSTTRTLFDKRDIGRKNVRAGEIISQPLVKQFLIPEEEGYFNKKLYVRIDIEVLSCHLQPEFDDW